MSNSVSMSAPCISNWRNLSDEILYAKCTVQHLAQLAEEIVKWEHLARILDLTESDIEEIKNDCANYLEKKTQCLIKWKQKFGSKATYSDLLKCLDTCKMREQAEFLVNILEQGKLFSLHIIYVYMYVRMYMYAVWGLTHYISNA